jgi:hypothetical protein
MWMQTRDFVNVAVRSHQLGCRVPVRTALLPGNFDTAVNAGEFCFHAATPHVRSAWQSVGLEDEGPDTARHMTESLPPTAFSPDRVPSGSQATRKVLDLQPCTGDESAKVPLAVFLGAALLTGPEWCLTVALSMVSRVLALDPCCASPRDVRLDVVVERPGERGCACIEYQGDAFGIVALCRDVRRIWGDA